MSGNVLDHSKRWGRLLSVEDAAAYLSISPNTIRGLDISTRAIGRRVLYDIHDLDRFVDRMTDKPVVDDVPDLAAAADEERRFFEKRAKRRAQH
jgi:hypothetical protein